MAQINQNDLTTDEKRILLALTRVESASPEKLTSLAEINVETAMRSALLLEQKGLSKIIEKTAEMYSLTTEGVLYAEKGLPEQRIIEFMDGKETFLSDLIEAFSDQEVNIALGWLRKKGWASIEKRKDEVVITPLSITRDPQKDILNLLYVKNTDLKRFDPEVIKALLNRNLIVATEKSDRVISLTDEGRRLVAEGIEIIEEITQLTPDLIRSGKWKEKHLRAYDVNAPVLKVFGAKKHPYRRLLDQMRKIFLEMGFEEIRGGIVQTSFWNFDALFQPQDHPAREMQDTFYLDSKGDIPMELAQKVKVMHEQGGDIGSTGWGGKWSLELARTEVLRTHTTAITIRHLSDNPDPPVKAFCIGRTYRRETIDSTHLPEFTQLEGVVMDEAVSFKNLLGCLAEFYKRMGFEKLRFRPGYFPYTEPSVEPEVYVEGLGWMELGGAGIFRREVTAPLGIRHPVLAWGLGVGRLAMLRLGLKDLRDLYRSDMGWLWRCPICQW
ncbi:MAG: phenylalanine--tRNA ligase subunit alpha [Methanocellales archaeon]|nr:phenylalanine--tRNA ligase subunit alpha [Methanocellales archaeon]MDD3291198.1 phenylalanine--tRNA ligase subunit alpha [Methanocellales archaeon]MDD5235298.1 phenylalanine--tRNA ligase subunit alpha [Methanocellales archaeon]MDD5484546.1 phenylalanine--tRNA ligase subunit alpha [Methanocellales archaeon]